MALVPSSTEDKLSTPDGSIILSYIYKGQCPECKNSVETLDQDIEIDNKNHHYILAYCINCKKQLQTKEVAKLEA